jgi:hypothetical protein
LEKWAEEIAAKFKISKVKGKTPEEEQLEIHHRLQPPDGMRPATAQTLASDSGDTMAGRMTEAEFDAVVESVKVAIELGVHPKMISQGSSGYFARNSEGKVVGVFKPKMRPYASRNPKWTKWIHRNLFPCFFGRACLIPNLSYVSEAAACVLTAAYAPTSYLILISSTCHQSPSTTISGTDQATIGNGSRYRRKSAAQVFLKGFKDANVFLRASLARSGQLRFRTEAAPKKGKPWAESCRPSGAPSDDEGRTMCKTRLDSPLPKRPHNEEGSSGQTPCRYLSAKSWRS